MSPGGECHHHHLVTGVQLCNQIPGPALYQIHPAAEAHAVGGVHNDGNGFGRRSHECGGGGIVQEGTSKNHGEHGTGGHPEYEKNNTSNFLLPNYLLGCKLKKPDGRKYPFPGPGPLNQMEQQRDHGT